MKDDRGLDRADLDRHLTGERELNRHDVNGCDDADCMVCNGLPAGLPDVATQLMAQSIFTANAMRNLADEMDRSSRSIPERYIRALREHAADLDRAAKG